MNDAHIYCTDDQFKEEFLEVCRLYLDYFKIFGIKKYSMRLSLHDKDGLGKKYVNEPELWLKTESLVREAMIDGKINFEEVEGEAAFYGPKIDVQIWSAIGKEFTLATNQVDFAIPKRLNLSYKDKNGKDLIPLCIHRAPLGTHERFIGFLIEHFGGNFPLWLAPIQVNVIPVSDKNHKYAIKVSEKLFKEGIRSTVNERSDKIGAKIRQAELDKINIMLIVGDKEELDQTVSYRRRFDGNMGVRPFKELKNELINEIKIRSLSHSKKK
jgi:threonyl-tRNA synthetase